MEQNFIGKWILMPDKSKYTQGKPPSEATYEFKKGKQNSLDVVIQWKDFEGKDFEISYSIIPDGKKYTYENPAIADEVMSSFETIHHLNSYTFKDNKMIAFASRIIDENGIMEVIQRFYTPDGSSYDNIQYYKKA